MDTYGHGQDFGEFAVAYCRKFGIDIDRFRNDIKNNSSTFFSGMDDGIGANRDSGYISLSHFEPEN